MDRSIKYLPLFLSLLGLLGCQTMLFEPGTPTASQRDGGTEGLFAKTSKFFKPSGPPSQPIPADSYAAPPTSLRVASNSLNASRLLYDFGPDGPGEAVPHPKVAAEVQSSSTGISALPPVENSETAANGVPNPLKPRNDDSPKLRSLLVEIEATPPEKLGISLDDAEKKIAKFRVDRKNDKPAWIENPQIEAQYLAYLRNMILPATASPKKQAPEEEIASKKKTVRRTPSPKVHEDETSEDETDESLLAEEEYDEDSVPAPLPPSKPVKKTKKESDAATLASQSQRPPQYPAIAQIDPKTSSDAERAASPSQGDIIQVGYTAETPNGDWKAQARIAADLLRAKIENTPNGRTFSNEANLRLLELALGNRQEAAKPFTQLEKPINEFWGNQMLGISTLLDEAGNPDRKNRYATAAFRFDEGLLELRRLCPMKLKNVQFVKDWVTFGVFLPRKEDCQAGDVVGLYMELDNPTVRRSALGYTVKPSIHYEIRDPAAKLVYKSEDMALEETTPSQKRDYCIHVNVRLPKSLAHGQYQLRVNVTDLNSENLQYAEEQLSFRVLPSAKSFVDE